MPSAQIIDFGPDPLTENMSKFASGFSDAFFKQQTQKKNEDIFQRIKEGYGPDAKPDRIFKDILQAEGLDEDYKRDLLKEVKNYASLEAQKDKSIYQTTMQDIRQKELGLKQQKADEKDQLTEFQKQNLKRQDLRLANERSRIDQASKKNEKDLPTLITNYTNSVLKNANEKINVADKALLNSRVQSNIKDDGMLIDEALEEALDYVNMKNQVVADAKIIDRPVEGKIWGAGPEQVIQAKQQAYIQLKQLYDSGIESQTDLRNIAKKSGWNAAEITDILQSVYSSNGRKLRTSKKSLPDQTQVSGSEQGTAQQVSGVDDILFGE